MGLLVIMTDNAPKSPHFNMARTKIKYNPTQTVEQMTEGSKASVTAVRRYIRSRNIDRRFDNQLLTYKRVQDYRKKHPEASYRDVKDALGYSLNTVKKYWLPESKPQKKVNGKISTLDKRSNMATLMTVSRDERVILSSILELYLNGAETFDCDLTTGQGDFYKTTIPRPQYCFDKYPQSEAVTDLKHAFSIRFPIFHSVVVDLPHYIEEKQDEQPNAFASLNEAYTTHEQILQTAFNILHGNGILVYKTTDFVVDGHQEWISDFAIGKAKEIGFDLIDKFIYINERRVMRRNSNQRFATKNHAFFFVFRKPATDSK